MTMSEKWELSIEVEVRTPEVIMKCTRTRRDPVGGWIRAYDDKTIKLNKLSDDIRQALAFADSEGE
jgi:hypothetical protein